MAQDMKDYTITVEIQVFNCGRGLVEMITDAAQKFSKDQVEEELIIAEDGDKVTIKVEPPIAEPQMPQIVYQSNH